MHVTYLPSEDWDRFYQSGHGLTGFEGVAFQRGGGLGNFLGRLFRFVLPVAKKVGKAVGKQALTSGADILDDVVKGRNIKESAKEHGRVALGNLSNKAGNYMRQKGRGRLGNRPKTIKGMQTLKRKQTYNRSRGAKRINLLRDVEVN